MRGIMKKNAMPVAAEGTRRRSRASTRTIVARSDRGTAGEKVEQRHYVSDERQSI
jgi:hypothetical protein